MESRNNESIVGEPQQGIMLCLDLTVGLCIGLVLCTATWLWTQVSNLSAPLICTSIKGQPGPWGFPVFGHLPRLGARPHIRLLEWSRVHGNAYFIRMGLWPALVVNGTAEIRRMLTLHGRNVSDRPDWHTFRSISGGRSVAFSSSNWYLHDRRLMHTGLNRYDRNYSSIVEEIASEETARLINGLLDEYIDGPRSFISHLKKWMGSILFSMLHVQTPGWFTQCVSNSKSPFAKAIEAVYSLVNNDSLLLCMADMIPPLARLFPGRLAEFRKVSDTVDSVTANFAHRDAESRQPDEAPRCLSDEFGEVCDEEAVSRLLTDIMGASLSTTISVVRWILFYLAMHPDWQAKVVDEMREQLGPDRRVVSWSEKQRLPRLRAFVAEVLRHSCGLLFLIPHCAVRDFTLDCGTHVTKGTIILCNMWSASRDAKVWVQPDDFDPDRFLNEAGDFLEAAGALFPAFGAGFRKCAGTKMAMQLLYNFTLRLLIECRVECATGPMPFHYRVSPLGIEAPEFPLRLIRRGREI